MQSKKKSIVFLLLTLISTSCHADLSKYLQADFGFAAKNDTIKNIDAVYLINLDFRPEKLANCLKQLDPYNIKPYRFSAVKGLDLPFTTLYDVGVKYQPGMLKGKMVVHYNPDTGKYIPERELLCKDFYGKNCFSPWNYTPGTIGCSLSHLSVLQNAYDCGYETIWVMEDDISVQANPHELGELISRLDDLVGQDGWDILYTDMDVVNCTKAEQETPSVSYLEDLWYYWRPDIDPIDQKMLAKRTLLSQDFIKIGSRNRTHSLIIRRGGMKKILSFLNKKHIFLPYDNELAIIPGINLVNLRYNLITVSSGVSDTQDILLHERSRWAQCQSEILAEIEKGFGCQDREIAEKVLEFVHKRQPKVTVGFCSPTLATSYAILRALQHLNTGTFFVIDSHEQKIEHSNLKDQSILRCLDKIDFTEFLRNPNYENYYSTIGKPSQDALSLFEDESVDMIVINGNSSSENSLDEAKLFLPKLKEGGHFWITYADQSNAAETLAYLMSHCKWIKQESFQNKCILLQKLVKNGI